MEHVQVDAHVLRKLCRDLESVTAGLGYLARLARCGPLTSPRLIPPYRDNHLLPLGPFEALYRTEAYQQFEQTCAAVGLASTLREERWICYACAKGDMAWCVPKIVVVDLHSPQPHRARHYRPKPGRARAPRPTADSRDNPNRAHEFPLSFPFAASGVLPPDASHMRPSRSCLIHPRWA